MFESRAMLTLTFSINRCVLTHTVLYHGRAVLNGMKRMDIEKDDIHAKLMRNYAEVPDWWYATVGVLFMGLAIIANEVREGKAHGEVEVC